MDERVASAGGLLLAIAVVAAVMNVHVVEDLVDDLRGFSTTPQAGRASTGGRSDEAPSGGGSRAGGTGPETGAIRTGVGRSASGGTARDGAGSGAGWWAAAAPMEMGRIVGGPPGRGRLERTDGGTTLPEHGGEDGDAAAPEGDGGTEERTEWGSEDLPVVRARRSPPRVALLRCAGRTSRLWIAALDAPTVSIPVDGTLAARLAPLLAEAGAEAASVSFVAQGCSPEQVNGARRVLSGLCAERLVGLGVRDLAQGRQLPNCGL